MTKEETQNLIDDELARLKVMRAFINGEPIQKLVAGSVDSFWVDEENPKWSSSEEYRIKPQPKVVPYFDVFEFIADLKVKSEDGFIVAKGEDPNVMRNVTGVSFIVPNCIIMSVRQMGKKNDTEMISLKDLALLFEWPNGQPCGKVITE